MGAFPASIDDLVRRLSPSCVRRARAPKGERDACAVSLAGMHAGWSFHDFSAWLDGTGLDLGEETARRIWRTGRQRFGEDDPGGAIVASWGAEPLRRRADAATWAALVRRATDLGCDSFNVSTRDLEQDSGMSLAAVRAALKRLESAGRVRKRRRGGHAHAATYQLLRGPHEAATTSMEHGPVPATSHACFSAYGLGPDARPVLVAFSEERSVPQAWKAYEGALSESTFRRRVKSLAREGALLEAGPGQDHGPDRFVVDSTFDWDGYAVESRACPKAVEKQKRIAAERQLRAGPAVDREAPVADMPPATPSRDGATAGVHGQLDTVQCSFALVGGDLESRARRAWFRLGRTGLCPVVISATGRVVDGMTGELLDVDVNGEPTDPLDRLSELQMKEAS